MDPVWSLASIWFPSQEQYEHLARSNPSVSPEWQNKTKQKQYFSLYFENGGLEPYLALIRGYSWLNGAYLAHSWWSTEKVSLNSRLPSTKLVSQMGTSSLAPPLLKFFLGGHTLQHSGISLGSVVRNCFWLAQGIICLLGIERRSVPGWQNARQIPYCVLLLLP